MYPHAHFPHAGEVPGDLAHGPLAAQALGPPLLVGERLEQIGRGPPLGGDHLEDLVVGHGHSGSTRASGEHTVGPLTGLHLTISPPGIATT